jgi:hypothetical protein
LSVTRFGCFTQRKTVHALTGQEAVWSEVPVWKWRPGENDIPSSPKYRTPIFQFVASLVIDSTKNNINTHNN